MNYKGLLQELLVKNKESLPIYSTSIVGGEPHAPTIEGSVEFTYKNELHHFSLTGHSTTKKAIEQELAQMGYVTLQSILSEEKNLVANRLYLVDLENQPKAIEKLYAKCDLSDCKVVAFISHRSKHLTENLPSEVELVVAPTSLRGAVDVAMTYYLGKISNFSDKSYDSVVIVSRDKFSEALMLIAKRDFENISVE